MKIECASSAGSNVDCPGVVYCSFQIYTPNSTWNIIEPKKWWFPNPESPLPRVPFSGKHTWLHQKCEVFVEFCRISSLKPHWTWRQFAVGTCAGPAMRGAADHGRLWHKGWKSGQCPVSCHPVFFPILKKRRSQGWRNAYGSFMEKIQSLRMRGSSKNWSCYDVFGHWHKA